LKHSSIYKLLLLLVYLLFSFSCKSESEKRFELLNSADSGINFINELTPSPQLNIFNYLYFYDGAGVAAGDLNGNGLPDLYFTSNQGTNRLYLNRGDFKFEDVTDIAFKNTDNFWSTGVTLVDINGSGMLDIYVSNVTGYREFEGYNQLFINTGNDEKGIPIFEEKAAEYGINFSGLSTQAAFFDYNRNGLLDMYLMNHSLHEFGTYDSSRIRQEHHPLSGDRFFRNDGGVFTDITEEAGIYSSKLGYGLGIGIGDVNQDGYPDIYIGNDFHEDDYLYVNNRDGTFTESLEDMIQHTSYSSMGNDIIDINNNGLLDIFSVDMLPEDYEKRQSAAEEDPLDIYNLKLSYGYKHKFSRNTLQLNRGNGKFSEIGMLAGVYATDWSWAALGADFNNSGYVDLFVSNGIKRRTNDIDYINFISLEETQTQLRGELTEEDLKLAERAPEVKIPNNMFKNNGSLFFDDVTDEWGFHQRTFSNGAIYVDLNNDGDLDLVINNVNQPASVFRNMTREKFPDSAYLKFKFNGPKGNTYGIGSKITIPMEDERVITRELFLSRGFQSAVEPVLHVGLDTLSVIPEIHIRWPDGKVQLLRNIDINQTLTVEYSEAAVPVGENTEPVSSVELFKEITDELNFQYKHEENSYIEFNREALIPHMVSREGPALAVGDVDENGLEDFYAGGARRQPGSLFIQQHDGTFIEKQVPAFETDKEYEDVDAHFADFTGNTHSDLLVVSGGNEYSGSSEYMLPRLYINDGNGNFIRDHDRLPEIYLTGSVAAIADINKNGQLDIFIGARSLPWNYGKKPESYLLVNKGDGYFEVDKSEYGKQFSDLGLVTDARWADMDNDGRLDLVVASEWSNLKIVFNDVNKGVTTIPNSSGLWNSVFLADLNNNGSPDILAGNLGLNSKFKAGETEPLRMYVNDFDGNGTVEQIITYIDGEGQERLFARKDELGEQMPYIHERFETYSEFANANLYEVVDRRRLDEALEYKVTDLRSSVFYNNENGFTRKALPDENQFSPIYTFLVRDLNGNGNNDVISAGNFFEVNIQRGRYDADYGSVLINDGNGNLERFANCKINWYLTGQIRKIDVIHIGNTPVLILAKNDEKLQFFLINKFSI
jgi:enediyne biosynthesis protein E4